MFNYEASYGSRGEEEGVYILIPPSEARYESIYLFVSQDGHIYRQCERTISFYSFIALYREKVKEIGMLEYQKHLSGIILEDHER